MVRGDKFNIEFLHNGFIQSKRVLLLEEEELITSNIATWRALATAKEKEAFKDKNKISSQQHEIWVGSPFWKAIENKNLGDTCALTLPDHQGGFFEFKLF